MNGPSDLRLERLLQDGAWLRRFVGTLVAPQDVDDVVQSTWLAAIEQRSRVAGNLAGWLRGVSTNLARMLHRSRHRHARAIGGLEAANTSPTAGDVVAGLEAQHVISDALLALPEPTRTILVLRYQRGLSPAAIGTRLGLRADAVRQRLRRGRDAVRERLQGRFGADWRGSAAVVAFAIDGGTPAPATVTPFALVAIAATALVTFTWANWTSHAPRAPMAAAANRPAEPAANATTSPASLAIERQLVATATQDPPPRTQDPTPPAKRGVRGRLVAAEDNSPIAGATVTFSSAREQVSSGPDGRFALASEIKDSRDRMCWFRSPGRVTRWCESTTALDVDLGDVPLVLGYTVQGRVVDEHGAPLARVRIEAPIDGEFPGSGRISFPTTTDKDGSFVFREPLPAGAITLSAGSPGIALTDGDVTILAQPQPNELVLHARHLRSISGVVFDPAGRPCAGVQICAFPSAVTRMGKAPFGRHLGHTVSRADGSFELFEEQTSDEVFVGLSEHAAHDLVGDRIPSAWGTRGLRITVTARIPVNLLVVEAETEVPITCFAYSVTSRRGGVAYGTGESPPREHPDNRITLAGVPACTDVVVWGKDPTRAPSVVIVDESMRTAPNVRVGLPKLEPFPFVLVDAADRPVATKYDLVDRCGDPAPGDWSDPHAMRFFTSSFATTPSALRLSGGSTDQDGRATLLAPADRRDLALCIERGQRKLWIPVVLPAAGAPLQLVVPD
ncbi:MAG TPA: sigma-70 family RNA polymerase sigma factor [Planctomycetota bacterium]